MIIVQVLSLIALCLFVSCLLTPLVVLIMIIKGVPTWDEIRKWYIITRTEHR